MQRHEVASITSNSSLPWPDDKFFQLEILDQIKSASELEFQQKAIENFSEWLRIRIPGEFEVGSSRILKALIINYIATPNKRVRELLTDHHDLILDFCRELRDLSETLRHKVLSESESVCELTLSKVYVLDELIGLGKHLIEISYELANLLRPDFAQEENDRNDEETGLWLDVIHLVSK